MLLIYMIVLKWIFLFRLHFFLCGLKDAFIWIFDDPVGSVSIEIYNYCKYNSIYVVTLLQYKCQSHDLVRGNVLRRTYKFLMKNFHKHFLFLSTYKYERKTK